MNKNKLGFYSIILLTINSIIGIGIFLTPGDVIRNSGELAPFVYLLAGILASLLAITFASAAKYVSKPGSSYAYTKAGFGSGVGLYVGITRFVTASIAWGTLAAAAVKSVMAIFKLDINDLKLVTIGFIILMLALSLIHMYGTRIFKYFNNISTIGKLFALITVIISGVVLVLFMGVNRTAELKEVAGIVSSKEVSLSMIVVATLSAFYAYSGFEGVASGTDDMQNPSKDLPIALPLGMLIIGVIYISIILTAIYVNPKGLLESKETITLISVFDNEIIRSIVFVGSLLSIFGINAASSFHTPRILEAMANEKQISKFFSKRTKHDFPLNAYIITALFAIVIPLTFEFNVGRIAVLSSISRFIQFILVPIAVMLFFFGKQKGEVNPNVKRNFFLDVIIPILALGFSLFLLINFNWKGQFTININGVPSLNYYAIIALIIGYVIIPFILYLNMKKMSKNN